MADLADRCRDLAAEGYSVDEIAAATGVHRTTVARRLRSPEPRPRGRPPQGHGRSVQVWTRLTPDEVCAIEVAAGAAGLRVAEWVRSVILGALDR